MDSIVLRITIIVNFNFEIIYLEILFILQLLENFIIAIITIITIITISIIIISINTNLLFVINY